MTLEKTPCMSRGGLPMFPFVVSFQFFDTMQWIGLTNLSNAIYWLLSKVHFTDLIKGQQHFTVVQIAGQNWAFWITATYKYCGFLKANRKHSVWNKLWWLIWRNVFPYPIVCHSFEGANHLLFLHNLNCGYKVFIPKDQTNLIWPFIKPLSIFFRNFAKR